MNVITRMAPSPTGSLHIGGVRTALYDYALAKKHGGSFILRIEDTDNERFVPGSAEEIVEMLEIYGIPADKLPSKESLELLNAQHQGEFDPKWILNREELEKINDDDFRDVYIQTQRLKSYQKHIFKLLDQGLAYPCFCTKERLAQVRDEQTARGERTKYDGFCRVNTVEGTKERIESGEQYVIRLNVEAFKKKFGLEVIKHNDAVMGEIEFPIEEVDDQVLIKSNGIPTYHFAVVVDDYLMKVTHVFRAAEWIPSTPKQHMVSMGLGWELPIYAHPTTILDPDGGKLSKRKGSVAAKEFLKEGYLPEAVMNFLMFLGWSSPEKHEHGEKEREFYTIEEFVDLFDLQNLNKSNPIFNREKLLWFNQKYIHEMPADKLVLKFTAWLEEFGKEEDEAIKKAIIDHKDSPDFLEEVLKLVQERVELLSQIPELIKMYYFEPAKVNLSEVKQLKNLDEKKIKEVINWFVNELNKYDSVKDWTHEKWEQSIREYAEANGLKAGEVFMTLRVATLGSPFSPALFESMEVLGKDEVAKRVSIYT